MGNGVNELMRLHFNKMLAPLAVAPALLLAACSGTHAMAEQNPEDAFWQSVQQMHQVETYTGELTHTVTGDDIDVLVEGEFTFGDDKTFQGSLSDPIAGELDLIVVDRDIFVRGGNEGWTRIDTRMAEMMLGMSGMPPMDLERHMDDGRDMLPDAESWKEELDGLYTVERGDTETINGVDAQRLTISVDWDEAKERFGDRLREEMGGSAALFDFMPRHDHEDRFSVNDMSVWVDEEGHHVQLRLEVTVGEATMETVVQQSDFGSDLPVEAPEEYEDLGFSNFPMMPIR